MATSETYNFNLNINEIIEEAFEIAGLEVKGGYQLKSARRSLDLLLTAWVNDGVNLWTIDQLEVPVSSGTNSYTLDARYVDLLDIVVRDSNNVDTTVNRISMAEWLSYPNKSNTGKPTQITVERNSTGGHTVYTYPTPDASYTLVTWAIRYPQDAGNYDNNPDIPRRFLTALTFGLAYYLALKNPAQAVQGEDGQMVSVNGVSADRRKELLTNYTGLYDAAKMEDRERASLWVVPDPSGMHKLGTR